MEEELFYSVFMTFKSGPAVRLFGAENPHAVFIDMGINVVAQYLI